jgi:short subunit dehydrogenase-like uncharacterized protein
MPVNRRATVSSTRAAALINQHLIQMEKRDMETVRYDLVVLGATGFTGKLVCAYLQQQHAAGREFSWAIAGRSLEKLEAVRAEIGDPAVSIMVADSCDSGSIERLTASTRLVVSTVGPYQLYGSALLAACARSGTDYVDVCGEPLWMREMIDRYEETAKASGARILFSCGFDSIPAELGVWLCQQEAGKVFGRAVPRIYGRMCKFIGGPSGGSMASGMAMMKLANEYPEKAAMLVSPFALTPGFQGPVHPPYNVVEDEPGLGMVGPFTLGPTDMKNVHRSNFLMGHPYGTDFIYDEKLVNPPPPPPQPPSLDSLPKPGEGPSAYIMENGCFELLMIGEDASGKDVRVVLDGRNDPYRTTSKLVCETALALLRAENLQPGIWTPIAALGEELVSKIFEHTGIAVRTAN